MEENTRKRSRKSKLVPRECSMDSDDENILVMQQEIEATLIQLKNKSILKKLSRPQIVPKPAQQTPAVSVKVEVEELNETRDSEANSSGIKIQSVTSLSEPPPLYFPGTSKDQDVDREEYFKFSEDDIRIEFERLSRRTTNPADKLIEMHVRNMFGRKRIPQESNYVDLRLMQIFRCKWKAWCKAFPDIRETPLLYKCHKCRKAWWHLYDFRDHVLRHKKHKIMAIELQTNCHESYIIAYANRVLAHSTLEDPHIKYSIPSLCWRCGKDYSHHGPMYTVSNSKYRCSGCMEKFYTCRVLFDHEHSCPLYRRSIVKPLLSEFSCRLCPARYTSSEELLRHMVLRHSVRSDIPEDWVLKVCSQCEYPFHLQVFHDCPSKPYITCCKFCAQKFNSHMFVLIHMNVTKHHYPCRVCGTVLRKECMELQHLMKHTANYAIIYKCTYCTDPKYYPTVKSINNHKAIAHKGKVENKNLEVFYDVTVVPKNMVKNMADQWRFGEDNSFKTVPSFKGIFGHLVKSGQPSGTTEKKEQTAIKGVKRGRPPKFPENELQGAELTQQECVITIPDSPERIEEDEVEIIEVTNQNEIIDISMPDDTQEIDMNSQECARENVNVDIASLKPLQENDNNASDDTQENNAILMRTPEYTQETDIASPVPHNYNVPDDAQENNDKEIAMKTPEIKQEIAYIASPTPLQKNDYNVPDDTQENYEIVMGTHEIKQEIADITSPKPLQENDHNVPDNTQENDAIVKKTLEIKQEIADIALPKHLQENNVPNDLHKNNEIAMKTPKIKQEIVDLAKPKPLQENDNNLSDNTQENTNEETIPESIQENSDDYTKASYISKQNNFDKILPNDVNDESAVNIQGQTYYNKKNIIRENIEVKTEVLDENDVNLYKDLQENENTQETFTDNLSAFPPTEINEFDTCLVIKEEKINHNEIIDNVQQEPVQMHEITENLTSIKKEPSDMDSDTQCNNVNFDHCYTITDSNNKLITQIDKIISKTNSNYVSSINHELMTTINTFNNDDPKSNVSKYLDDTKRRAILALDKLRCKKTKSSKKVKADTKCIEIKLIKKRKSIGKKKNKKKEKLDIIGINELEAKMTGNVNLEEKTEINNQLNLQIKEEVGEQNYNNCTEEDFEELMESDMIILDPRKCVTMEYQMDPSTSTSVTSNEVDMRPSDQRQLVVESSIKRLYRCTKCLFEGFHHEYRQHVTKLGHHAVKRPKAKVCKSKPGNPLFCSKCGRDFSSPCRYASHFSKVHGYKPRTCPKCYYTLQTMKSLHGHIIAHVKENFCMPTGEEEEKERSNYQCQMCSQWVASADCFDHWERHLELNTNTDTDEPEKIVLKPLMRMGDDDKLQRMLLLLQGINPDNPNEKVYNLLKSCPKCKRPFARRNECKRHFIEHLLQDAVQRRPRHGFLECQLCAQQFLTGARYKWHMRDHGNLPLYKCELCDKAFSDSSNFTKHKKVHNLSVVICDICNKKFTTKLFLEKHLRMHEVTKPLVCNECGRLFYCASSYRRHMRKGRAQFKCKICYMRFNAVKNMWDHMWEEHGVRKFIADCPICHKSFRKHADVKKHLRENHNKGYKYNATTRMKPLLHPRISSVPGLVVVAKDKRGNCTVSQQGREVKRKRLPVLQRVIALQDPQTQATPETMTSPAQENAGAVPGPASPVQGTAGRVQGTVAGTYSTASKQRKTMKRLPVSTRVITLQVPGRQATSKTMTRPAQETASPAQETDSLVQGTASLVQEMASPVCGTASPVQENVVRTCSTASKRRKTTKRLPVNHCVIALQGPQTQVTPDTKDSPAQGTASPVQGTASPVQVTAHLVPGTASPLQGTASPIQGTASPIQGTASPIQGTASPIQGTASPIQGTASPVQVSARLVQGTASSEQGTASPLQETVVKTEPVEF